MSNKNYFNLCNEVLQELFYEKVDTFEELSDITEGEKVKQMLNDSLIYICNNENTPWRFRDVDVLMPLVSGIKEYNNVNGYIDYIRYVDTPIVLKYDLYHKYNPINMVGMPLRYWIDEGKIKFDFTPDDNQNNRLLSIHYVTNDFAKDECGNYKPLMVNATDVPIIPIQHRNILKWDVCANWRASINDAKAAYYRSKYKEAYRALLSNEMKSDDYPNILDIMAPSVDSNDAILRAFDLPQTRYNIRRLK